MVCASSTLNFHPAEGEHAEGTKEMVLTNAPMRTMTKGEYVAVEANRVGGIVRPVQPSIEIEFVGVFTENTRQYMITGDVDPDILTL